MERPCRATLCCAGPRPLDRGRLARRGAAGDDRAGAGPATVERSHTRACGCATTSTRLHGHYGDRHTTVPMFERLGAGAMARIVGERDRRPERAEDYEAALAPMYAWIHAIAQTGGQDSTPPTRSSHGPSARAWGALAGAAPGRGGVGGLGPGGFPGGDRCSEPRRARASAGGAERDRASARRAAGARAGRARLGDRCSLGALRPHAPGRPARATTIGRSGRCAARTRSDQHRLLGARAGVPRASTRPRARTVPGSRCGSAGRRAGQPARLSAPADCQIESWLWIAVNRAGYRPTIDSGQIDGGGLSIGGGWVGRDAG